MRVLAFESVATHNLHKETRAPIALMCAGAPVTNPSTRSLYFQYPPLIRPLCGEAVRFYACMHGINDVATSSRSRSFNTFIRI